MDTADLIQTYWRKAQLAELPAPDIELSTWTEATQLMPPIVCVACDYPAADRCANCGEWYCKGCLCPCTDDDDRPYCYECADHLAGERIALARKGIYGSGRLVC